MDTERAIYVKFWKAQHAAGYIPKQTLDKLLQRPSFGGAVAQVHVSERSIDLCNNENTRKLRELVGDGIHNLYLSPLQARAQDSRCGELLEAAKDVLNTLKYADCNYHVDTERLTKAIAAFEEGK